MRNMRRALSRHLSTLKSRLIVGAIALLGVMGAATWVGVATVDTLTDEMTRNLSALGTSTQIGAELEDLILRQFAEGEEYLRTADPEPAARFADLGWQAHRLGRRYRELPGLDAAELGQVETVEALLAEIEVEYALAHALLDVGRADEARALVAAVGPTEERLQSTIRAVSAVQADKINTAAAELQRTGEERQRILLLALLLALLVVAWIIYAAIRGIDAPLGKLVGAARQMGEGDLRVQLNGKMLHEFDALAGSFNTMAGQLRTLVLETVSISEQISVSAFDLSSISEEVASSSGEVAGAMVDITQGAERQSRGLVATSRALTEMSGRAKGIAGASQHVSSLSGQIHQVADRTRAQVQSALQVLLEIRAVVQGSEQEARELEEASSQIERFVETISGIARQTNLLALNAAIEAARAGEHGRGFAVVAEEVRKLADGSAQAAQEVTQTVRTIRTRITRMVGTMEQGTRKVVGVEEAAQTAGGALEQIMLAVEDIRVAAAAVADAVTGNQDALQVVESRLEEVSGTAESHAASAQQVSAAAQEQSAATEQMSASSAELLQAAERMKELVSGLKV